jgi:hypothetical protein
MKTLSALALLSSLLLSQAAHAAATFECKILIPHDPVNNPNSFTDEISHVTVSSDEQTHYVLLSKDVKAAEEISRDVYFQHKAEKFKTIEGQYVVAYQADDDGLIALTFGKTDAASGILQGGATFFAQNAPLALVIPTNAGFGASCSPKK